MKLDHKTLFPPIKKTQHTHIRSTRATESRSKSVYKSGLTTTAKLLNFSTNDHDSVETTTTLAETNTTVWDMNTTLTETTTFNKNDFISSRNNACRNYQERQLQLRQKLWQLKNTTTIPAETTTSGHVAVTLSNPSSWGGVPGSRKGVVHAIPAST